MDKKKMIVNVASCDMRDFTEEIANSYESIVVNSAMVVVSKKSKEILARCDNVTLNTASVIEAEDGVEIKTLNGSAEITPENAPTNKTLLVVNGSLKIRSCPPEALENYVAIVINGTLTCTESVSAAILAKATVNGSISVYPDGAVVLKKNAAIDKVFVLRARDSLYWAKSLLFLDTEIDAEALRAKGARFAAKKVIIAESVAAKLADLISEEADMLIVPDGTAFVNDDADLDEDLIARFGTKLYINGDLDVKDGADEALDELQYIFVNGDVSIYAEHKAKFFALKPQYDELRVIDKENERRYDKVLEEKVSVKIDKAVLETCPGGVLVSECAMLKIAPDVPSDMILERLTISECAMVKCSPEQESAVSFVASECAHISTGEDDEGEGGGLLSDIFGGIKGLMQTKMVNAAEYKF